MLKGQFLTKNTPIMRKDVRIEAKGRVFEPIGVAVHQAYSTPHASVFTVSPRCPPHHTIDCELAAWCTSPAQAGRRCTRPRVAAEAPLGGSHQTKASSSKRCRFSRATASAASSGKPCTNVHPHMGTTAQLECTLVSCVRRRRAVSSNQLTSSRQSWRCAHARLCAPSHGACLAPPPSPSAATSARAAASRSRA